MSLADALDNLETPRHADTCPPCARMRAGAADWPGRPPRLELQIAHARRRSLGGRFTWALMGLLMRKER